MQAAHVRISCNLYGNRHCKFCSFSKVVLVTLLNLCTVISNLWALNLGLSSAHIDIAAGQVCLNADCNIESSSPWKNATQRPWNHYCNTPRKLLFHLGQHGLADCRLVEELSALFIFRADTIMYYEIWYQYVARRHGVRDLDSKMVGCKL